ncbi:TUT4 [Symbiodinium sp. CCMP2592]|nr:TUT4 [Symbiodinium sp. CCMP2592]
MVKSEGYEVEGDDSEDSDSTIEYQRMVGGISKQPNCVFQNTYMVGVTPLNSYEQELKLDDARMHTYLIRGVDLRNLAPPAEYRAETIAHAMIVQGQATWGQLQRLLESLPGDSNMRWEQSAISGAPPKRFTVGAWLRGPMAGINQHARKFPWTCRALAAIVRTWDEELMFTDCTLSLNIQALPHPDSHNHPASMNLALPCSDCTGGQIFVEHPEGKARLQQDGVRVNGHILSTREAVSFSPRCTHATLPWNGDRLLLLSFHIDTPRRLCTDDVDELRLMGQFQKLGCSAFSDLSCTTSYSCKTVPMKILTELMFSQMLDLQGEFDLRLLASWLPGRLQSLALQVSETALSAEDLGNMLLSLPRELEHLALCASGPAAGDAAMPKLEINELDEDTSPSTAKPEPRRIGERRDALDVELQRLAQAVLPRPSDQRSKAKVLTDLEDIATAVLGTKATVYPFGSSANGCGERLSDIDAVLDIVDGFDASDAGFVLSAIEEACEDYGFAVDELRASAKVPILMLRKDGYEIDLSFGNILPLLNTRLLRTYAMLEPRVPLLTTAVKRWAKGQGLAKTWDRFISSYAWTLMVIYFLQISGKLPSLHALRQTPSTHAAFNDQFATPDEAVVSWEEERVQPLRGAGDLLRGFFRFYAEDFDWQSEVVSVRMGSRNNVSSVDHVFHPRMPRRPRGGGEDGCLHIEDPIEIGRNLNFALTGDTLYTLRWSVDMVHERFQAASGQSLAEALQLKREHFWFEDQPGLPPLQSNWTPAVDEGFLEIPKDPARSLSKACACCGRRGRLGKMLNHEARCRHVGGSGNFCCELCGKCFETEELALRHQDVTGHFGEIVSRDEVITFLEKTDGIPGLRRRKFLRRGRR